MMGRVKLKIKKLENTNGRQATFAKRKNGILKKASELSILCDIDLVLLMFSPTGKPAITCGTRRKLESLENLKKTFEKLDHNVNIREFIASSNSTTADLSTQARFLQAHISGVHGRLSYWTELDKINNIEHLGQLEISIRQSLDHLRAHKEQLGQQQQAMQIEKANFVNDWSTCLMEDGIQIPLEQQLQSMSWILNGNTTNIVTEEQNLIPKREVNCSASSSLGSYQGYFGTGKSPEIAISGQETSFLDEQLKPQTISQQQFTDNNITAYNPNLHHDLNHHQPLAPPLPPLQVYIPMNQREYHMNELFEAPPPVSSGYNNSQTRFGSSNSSLPCSLSMFDEYLFSQMQQPN